MIKQRPTNSVTFTRDPKFEHIEARFSHYTREAFKKHTHETYAIGVVTQGSSNYFHLNQTYIIKANMAALINPGEVHACNPTAEAPWSYRMLYIDENLMNDVAAEMWEGKRAFAKLAPPIVDDARLYHLFKKLYDVFVHSDNRLEKDSCIHNALVYLLTHYSQQQKAVSSFTSTDEATLKTHDYLMVHLTENIALKRLAAVAGLSAYHLLRAFKQRYGLPPHTFQVQQRIHAAKKMLLKGDTIALVANELGFTDQSHFTKKFKSFVGATPKQYQEKSPLV